MRKYLTYFLLIIISINCALRKSVQPSLNQLTILYINNWSIEQSAKISNLVKIEKRSNPVLTIINNNIFSYSPLTELNKGQVEIDILNASQIDAMLFTPDFLRWGIEHGQELIKNANFYCLGANIKNIKTNQTIGQEFLYQALDKAQIAVLGISYDSANYYFKPKNILFQNQEFTILKFKPLIENRTDFQLILTNASDTLDFSFDLILGAPTKTEMQLLPSNESGIYRIVISYDNLKNIHQIQRTNIALDTITEDKSIKEIILSYQARTDSLLNNTFKNKIDNNWAIKTLLTNTKSQTYLSDQPMLDKKSSVGAISFQTFYNSLTEKASLPIIIIKGKELKTIKNY